MKIIENLHLDEERALYNQSNIKLVNVKFDGPLDGESALKECEDICIEDCYFNLRYPLWHVNNCCIKNIEMTDKCRAAIWYTKNIKIEDSKLHGIKALRECDNVSIKNSSVMSLEFGWKSSNIMIDNSSIMGEYLFLDSNKITINEIKLSGKYSFQYVQDLEINDSNLDTKDAFWHAKNVVVKNSVLKGEYLGWYSENLTLINCKIIGTQPLCYCKNLTLVDCIMENCDLSFENSEVNGNVLGYVESIKNPYKGIIRVGQLGSLIQDDEKYKCNGKVIVSE